MKSPEPQFVLSNEVHDGDVPEFPRVIRRDVPGDISGKPRVVPWLGHKIARAVAAACAAQGEDEIIGRQVQAEIEFRIRRGRPAFYPHRTDPGFGGGNAPGAQLRKSRIGLRQVPRETRRGARAWSNSDCRFWRATGAGHAGAASRLARTPFILSHRLASTDFERR